jgi:hypothetical protein
MFRLLPPLAWFWLTAAIPFVTNVSMDFMAFLALVGSGITIGVLWLIITVASFRARMTLWWLSVPVAGLLGVLLATTGYGVTLRVLASEPWLKAYAEEVQAAPGKTWDARWVGLFYVDETEEYNGVVYLYTATGFINRYGIAFNPRAKESARRIGVWPLYGPWCGFVWRF